MGMRVSETLRECKVGSWREREIVRRWEEGSDAVREGASEVDRMGGSGPREREVGRRCERETVR